MKNSIAGILIGMGLAFGFLPILIASIILKENMFVTILDLLDRFFWKPRLKELGATDSKS